jgi:hypothetical protein
MPIWLRKKLYLLKRYASKLVRLLIFTLRVGAPFVVIFYWNGLADAALLIGLLFILTSHRFIYPSEGIWRMLLLLPTTFYETCWESPNCCCYGYTSYAYTSVEWILIRIGCGIICTGLFAASHLIYFKFYASVTKSSIQACPDRFSCHSCASSWTILP